MSEGKLEVMPNENPFAVKGQESSGATMDIATSRQAQEVMASMAIAKRFPRNEEEAYSRIMNACKRKHLAEKAVYSYPKGGQNVQGPSIRMAEVLAQNWGNIDFGIIELDQRSGESTVMAYAWDLQTNTRQTKVFQVAHTIKTKKGPKVLDDPREIYELSANMGARRMRACILGVIPGDIVEAALDECDKTLAGENKEPLGDQIRKMVAAFSELGVSDAQLGARMGKPTKNFTQHDIINLRKVFTSLRDGMSKVSDWFENVQAATAPDMPKEPPKEEPPADTTPEPEPTPAPTAGAPSILDQLKDAMHEDGVTDAQLVELCKKRGLAKATQTSVAQLSEAKLKDLLQNWDTVKAELGK